MEVLTGIVTSFLDLSHLYISHSFLSLDRQDYKLHWLFMLRMYVQAAIRNSRLTLLCEYSVRLKCGLQSPSFNAQHNIENSEQCKGVASHTPESAHTIQQAIQRFEDRQGTYSELLMTDLTDPTGISTASTAATNETATSSGETPGGESALSQGILAGDNSPGQSPAETGDLTSSIIVSIDRQPPVEVRPEYPLAPVVVKMKISGLQGGENTMPGDDGSLFVQASVISPDGQLPMARFVPDILTGSHLQQISFQRTDSGDGAYLRLTLRNLTIHQSGYFRIHIALIHTSTHADDVENDDPVVAAPVEVLSIDTRVIHVHAFAPIGESIGELSKDCSSALNAVWLLELKARFEMRG